VSSVCSSLLFCVTARTTSTPSPSTTRPSPSSRSLLASLTRRCTYPYHKYNSNHKLTCVYSIFLYVVLLSAFAGTVYFIYNTWISTFFPQKKGRGKGGERAKKSSGGSKKVDPADQIAVVGADGPAVTSGAKAYDESWIPVSHLQRPEAKRVRSGTPKLKTKA
jgi:hypothetical protein